VIERMFSLIDVLASREEAVSLKEISEKTGLHPSTTHRILNDLATGRFVDRPKCGKASLLVGRPRAGSWRRPNGIRP
jgi:DNA-binding IclR family transcriptional regulator